MTLSLCLILCILRSKFFLVKPDGDGNRSLFVAVGHWTASCCASPNVIFTPVVLLTGTLLSARNRSAHAPSSPKILAVVREPAEVSSY